MKAMKKLTATLFTLFALCFAAGIEQQQYNIIEELQVRMNENLDWNIIRLMEEESK